jgi:hypothetical protein
VGVAAEQLGARPHLARRVGREASGALGVRRVAAEQRGHEARRESRGRGAAAEVGVLVYKAQQLAREGRAAKEQAVCAVGPEQLLWRQLPDR